MTPPSGAAIPADPVPFRAPKETPPPGSAPKPFRLPPTEDFVLANGMKVTLVPYGSVPKVAVRAYVNAGGVYESANQVWISKLNALLMKEGTATLSSEQVASRAAGMGGQLDIGAGAEFAAAGGVVLSEFGTRFVALLAEVLQRPALPASELARLKADLRRALVVEKSRPGALARERFLKTLFPDHPYGRSYPRESALEDYTAAEVQRFFDDYFTASRTHLYIAGKLDPDLKKSITAAFGGWKRGSERAGVPVAAVKSRSLQLVDRPGAEQSTLYLGLPVADPTSPDFVALGVMDALLGGSFASRITSNIREQKGYTYSPFSQIGTRRRLAYWLQGADVTTSVTGPALHEIFHEINRLRNEEPSVQEVKGIQDYLAGLFILRNTVSPDAVIAQLHFVDSQGLDRSFLSSYVQKIMAITPRQIQRAAETYIVPSGMTIVVVGDQAKIAEQLKAYETAV